MTKKESHLDAFKKRYKGFQDKYRIPEFSYMNENFEIEKLAEAETETLLREIRGILMEKISSYMRFIEMLLNPSNAPLFFFSLFKGLSEADKLAIERIYEKLADFEIMAMELNNRYSEKGDAEFIKNIGKEWEDVKDDMGSVIGAIKTTWKVKKEKKERNYFG